MGPMTTVLSLFDKTGNMVRPWLDAGYMAVVVDIQHEPGTHWDGHLCRIGADMRDWTPPRWLALEEPSMISAFPPCDHLSVSGARWFKSKGLESLQEALGLVLAAKKWCEWFECPYMLENPVSTLSTYWRKPDHTFEPWQYTQFEPADNYHKKTCLWTGHGFVMPDPAPLPDIKIDTRIHRAAPGPDRKDFRSATPLGFARAVFEANDPDRPIVEIAAE